MGLSSQCPSSRNIRNIVAEKYRQLMPGRGQCTQELSIQAGAEMMVTKEHWSGAISLCLKVPGNAGQGEKRQVLDLVFPDKLTLSTGHTQRPTSPLLEDGLQFCLGFFRLQPGNAGSSPLDFSAAETCLGWTPNPSNM